MHNVRGVGEAEGAGVGGEPDHERGSFLRAQMLKSLSSERSVTRF